MNEEEKGDIELDIEAKYVDKTEKEFLSNITYAECVYILTPENKYCDKIRELSVLKLCEIIEKLQKENEELKEDRDKFKKALGKRITYCNELEKDLFENGSNYVIPKQKVKEKIEELIKEGRHYNANKIEVLQELLEKRR
jgi:hypothetical protein|nr:MAG TPA: hypothetical protein [Bacteriophage sp.]